MPTESNSFQFLIVRLKYYLASNDMVRFEWFQFLIVRLKSNNPYLGYAPRYGFNSL